MSASPLRHIPNAITVARLLLVAPTAYFLWRSEYQLALVLMAVAGASDAVDGWLARRFGWTSKLGATLDPVADKLLVGALFVVLTLQGLLPPWLVAIVVGRDAIIMAGAGIYRLLFTHLELVPTFISKANTALQIVLLLLFLLMLCELPVVSDLARRAVFPYGVTLVAILGVVSGLDYVVTWSRRAIHQARERGRV
jgi:cardiolipin synthase